MSDAVTLGTTLAFGSGALAMLAFFGWKSVKQQRVEPMLMLTLAMIPLFWLESPGDWAFWAQYNPNFAHAPDWGPIGMTWGGLPLIAIPGYPFYWVPPMFIAVYLARRVSWSPRFSATQRLLISGLGVGFVWDFIFEIFAIRVGIWRMAYAPWGLTLWPGTKYQYPMAITLVVAIFCMFCTFLIGRTDDHGDVVLLGWAKRHTRSTPGAHLLHFGLVALSFQVVYLFTFIPIIVVHLLGYVVHQSPEPLFGDTPLQPTPGMGNGPMGFVILVGGAVLQVWIIFAVLNRLDARLTGSSPARAASPVGSNRG